MTLRFEGEEIDGYTVTVKGFKGPLGMPLMRGERLEVTMTCTVIEVAYRENRRTGQVFRDHVVQIAEVKNSG